MRKLQFKKILLIVDAIELREISLQEAPLALYEEIANEYYAMKLSAVEELFDFLVSTKLICDTGNGIDLTPAATVYAKSNQNSRLEAYAIVEAFLKVEKVAVFFQKQCQQNPFCRKEEILQQLGNNEIFCYLAQTMLFEIEKEAYRIHPKLLKGIRIIVDEYKQNDTLLISTALMAYFTDSVVSHSDLRIHYKNSERKMVDYDNKDIIYTVIPRLGIPHDRDETKAMQSFYKDTLFHEFHHACPICHIRIPHMLIASHIKPFRDCAHIFEAVDHNNGLLLCRNHDYLFDQGYFTFDDRGYVILSHELLKHMETCDAYGIAKNYRIPKEYMTKNRRLFLAYHRAYIFKDKLPS